MRKGGFLIICFLVLCPLKKIRAQYYSVNVDAKTASAMQAAYATEYAAELFYYNQIKDILDHYKNAELSSSTVFSSEYLKRRALTDLSIFSSETENYYYRRIYYMVSAKIMPKIWTVVKLMLRYPAGAFYWSQYIMKITEETKSLCMQFESIVTNSTLSFSDILFLQIREDIKNALDLSNISNVDFKAVLYNFSKVSASITKENLKAEIDRIYSEQLLPSAKLTSLMDGNILSAVDIVDHYENLFQNLKMDAGGTLLSLVGGAEGVANFFQMADYDISSWKDDYAKNQEGEYYRQRWYIYKKHSEIEKVCSYYPPNSTYEIQNGSEWLRFSTSSSSFNPTSAQDEVILQNSEKYAGWSRQRIEKLNSNDDGNVYTMTSSRLLSEIKDGYKLLKKAYAYIIIVERECNRKEIIYEELFDSYHTDEQTFLSRMNSILESYNRDSEDGQEYFLEGGEKNYYSTATDALVNGVEAVTISVTCHDGATLSEGSNQYKCSDCGSSLSEHTKECSMITSVTDVAPDISELESMRDNIQSKITGLETAISDLEKQRRELQKLLEYASQGETNILREQYNTISGEIEKKQAELKTSKQDLSDLLSAIEEARKSETVQTDDFNRIPSIMSSLSSSFNLSWNGQGRWSGYTFLRDATMPNVNGNVTFKAELSIARKPKYFLGIQIHRAIVQIKWSLKAEYSDTHVEAVVNLDPQLSDEEKADVVNSRISEIARQYPTCQITTEYERSSSVKEDDSNDRFHLLLPCDRLEIAREVDSRITEIYSSLVSLEKMMSYRRDIIDYLKDIAQNVNMDEGRRLSILQQCQKRWKESSRGKSNK